MSLYSAEQTNSESLLWSVHMDTWQVQSTHTIYDTRYPVCVLWWRPSLLCLSLSCLVWIQLAHCVVTLISHSESLRVWVCVPNSNGISIFPKPWVVAGADAHSNNSTWHQCNTPANLTFRRKKDKLSSFKCFLFDIFSFNSPFPQVLSLLVGAVILGACRHFTFVIGNQKLSGILTDWQKVWDSRPSWTSQFSSKGESNWLIIHFSVPGQERCCFCIFTWLRCFC